MTLDFERKGFKPGNLVQIAVWMRDFPKISCQLTNLNIFHPLPPHWTRGCNVDDYASLIAKHRQDVEKILSENSLLYVTSLSDGSVPKNTVSQIEVGNFKIKKKLRSKYGTPLNPKLIRHRRNRKKTK